MEDKGARKIQGLGSGFIPEIYDPKVVDEIKTVSDEDALRFTKIFAEKEGVLVGISSGASILTAVKVAKELGKGKKVLAIAPDGGEKYISMEFLIKMIYKISIKGEGYV